MMMKTRTTMMRMTVSYRLWRAVLPFGQSHLGPQPVSLTLWFTCGKVISADGLEGDGDEDEDDEDDEEEAPALVARPQARTLPFAAFLSLHRSLHSLFPSTVIGQKQLGAGCKEASC